MAYLLDADRIHDEAASVAPIMIVTDEAFFTSVTTVTKFNILVAITALIVTREPCRDSRRRLSSGAGSTRRSALSVAVESACRSAFR
jgi:hypothetical protein